MLGISFPPVADADQRAFTAPLLEELGVTHIRIGENWANREPENDRFNWAPLDGRIEWAEKYGLEVLLTIQSNGPEWACAASNEKSCVYGDYAEFQAYVEALFQRYANRISKVQFGNEWQTEWWYLGTAEQFTEASNIVYRAARDYSPQTVMVLGGFTTISLRGLAACAGLVDSVYDDGGNLYDDKFFTTYCQSAEFRKGVDRITYVLEHAQYDELDIHLYDDAEKWPIYVEHFSSLVNQPIIVTEFGGPNVNMEPRSESYQAERLARYIRTIDELGIEEAYFFKLVEGSGNPAHAISGLISSPGLKKKESYWVFEAFMGE